MEEPLELKDRYAKVPNRAGLGVELVGKALRKYQVEQSGLDGRF